MGRRGQVWSVDLVIGMLIFLVAVGTIYSFLNNEQSENSAELRIESDVVATVLTTGGNNPQLKVANENQLDMGKLGNLAKSAQVNYSSLKRDLGVEHDFCIYLQDEEGNLVYIQDPDGNRYAGIGSQTGDINLTFNTPCGQQVA